jgi:SAM-dependent methyltransferase
MMHPPEFDHYAEDYDAALAKGLAVSGEDREHFARGRIAFLVDCLQRLRLQPGSVMDFGCGTGASTPFLLSVMGARSVVGIDASPKCLEVARGKYGSEEVQFLLPDQYQPSAQMDLIFCNGTFHHIPLGARATAVNYIYRSLRPDGLFALWENNPWNPGTRYIMSRCVFDRDAITLTAPEACRLLRAVGFEVLGVDFLFIFPRALRWFRGIEALVSRLPLGAQYQVLCRRP